MRAGRDSRRPGHGFKNLGGVLDELMDEMGLGAKREFGRLAAAWPEIVGKDAAQNSLPVKIEHGNLKVLASDPAWSQNLVLYQADILKRIKEKFPLLRVRSLSLRVKQDLDTGRSFPAVKQDSAPGQAELNSASQPLPEELERVLESIPDLDLRAATRKVMLITRRKSALQAGRPRPTRD